MASHSLLISLFLLAGVGLAFGHFILDEDHFAAQMEGHLKNFMYPRYPRPENRGAWLASRQYVMDKFRLYGLNPHLQCFNTSVQTGIGFDSYETVTGCNVIGVSHGEQDLPHRMVVGAHFDTAIGGVNNRPLRRDGAGISTLIEVAKAYRDSILWKGYKSSYTTIFVAFDLNTLEESTRNAPNSVPGSKYFVDNYLGKNIESYPLSGSFVIDSIASYNTKENTQSLPSDFSHVFPEAYTEIRDTNEGKGNFLAAVTNNAGKSLLQDFAKNFEEESDGKEFRLQQLVAEDFGNGRTYQMFEEYDSRAFWLRDHPLSCILLTDTTDDYRGLNRGDMCDEACTLQDFLTADRKKFLYSTYKALAQTLLDKQAEPTDSGSGMVQMSWLTLVACVAIARVFASAN